MLCPFYDLLTEFDSQVFDNHEDLIMLIIMNTYFCLVKFNYMKDTPICILYQDKQENHINMIIL